MATPMASSVAQPTGRLTVVTAQPDQIHAPAEPRRYRRTKAEALVYTVAEVSQLLSLSRGSTYALVREGTIPAVRMGGRWLIPKKRFHAWLETLNSEVA